MVWHIVFKQKNMQHPLQHLKEKIKPFHLFAALYALFILAGIIYKLIKQ